MLGEAAESEDEAWLSGVRMRPPSLCWLSECFKVALCVCVCVSVCVSGAGIDDAGESVKVPYASNTYTVFQVHTAGSQLLAKVKNAVMEGGLAWEVETLAFCLQLHLDGAF